MHKLNPGLELSGWYSHCWLIVVVVDVVVVVMEAERGQGYCVKKHNQAITHQHLMVSQFLIEQASHTKHTRTHFQSQTCLLSVSFPLCASLTVWLQRSSHSPLASVVNSLDLENLWCQDFAWWKRTCSSLLEKITCHPRAIHKPSIPAFQKRKKVHKSSSDSCAFEQVWLYISCVAAKRLRNAGTWLWKCWVSFQDDSLMTCRHIIC